MALQKLKLFTLVVEVRGYGLCTSIHTTREQAATELLEEYGQDENRWSDDTEDGECEMVVEDYSIEEHEIEVEITPKMSERS